MITPQAQRKWERNGCDRRRGGDERDGVVRPEVITAPGETERKRRFARTRFRAERDDAPIREHRAGMEHLCARRLKEQRKHRAVVGLADQIGPWRGVRQRADRTAVEVEAREVGEVKPALLAARTAVGADRALVIAPHFEVGMRGVVTDRPREAIVDDKLW